jgi:O-antigen ligase
MIANGPLHPTPPRIESLTRLLLWGAAGAAVISYLLPTHEVPWTSFHSEFAMAAAGLLAMWGVLAGRQGRLVALPGLALFSLVLAVTPLLQLLFGKIVFAGDAVLASLYLVSFAAMVVAGYHATQRWSAPVVLEAFAWTVLVAALVSAGLVAYQWQRLEFLGEFASAVTAGERPYANLNQPNQLAALVVLGFVAVACLFDGRRIGVVGAVLATGLLGLGLAPAQSRAAWLELAVVLVVVVIKRRALTGRLGLLHLAIGLLLVAASYLAWAFLDASAAQAVARDPVLIATSTSNRLIHWRAMIDALARAPWSGYGWMGVSSAQYAVVTHYPATYEIVNFSHNLVLDLLVWTGVPFGLAIVGYLVTWLWRVASRVMDSTALLALAALLTLVSYAQVEFPLAYTLFLLPAGALAGLLCATTLPKWVRPMPVWVMPTGSAAGAVVLALVLCDYLEVERQLQVIRFNQAHIGLHRPRTAESPIRLLTQLDALLRFARTPEREGMSDAELREMGHVAQRYPSSPNLVRYAAALAINGQQDAAVQVLRRICKLALPPECDAMQRLWDSLGGRYEAIRQVAWPTPNSTPS